MDMFREQIGKRSEFINMMKRGNSYLKAINQYKETLQSEDEKNNVDVTFDFNLKLNKGMLKYNCLKHWKIEILNTNEERLDNETERMTKNGSDIFNTRNQIQKGRNGRPILMNKGSSVSSFLAFRKNDAAKHYKLVFIFNF